MLITDLGEHPSWIPTLARWHFEYWGPLTGSASLDAYVASLASAAQNRTVPSVLIAVAEGELLGSANLVGCDLPVGEALTPWLAQLFVEPTRRREGVGAALVRAVLHRARECGYRAGPSIYVGHSPGVLRAPRMAARRAVPLSRAGTHGDGLRPRGDERACPKLTLSRVDSDSEVGCAKVAALPINQRDDD
jgi:GNAT superfamily N-acetyltransferase